MDIDPFPVDEDEEDERIWRKNNKIGMPNNFYDFLESLAMTIEGAHVLYNLNSYTYGDYPDLPNDFETVPGRWPSVVDKKKRID